MLLCVMVTTSVGGDIMKNICPDCNTEFEQKSAPADKIDKLCPNCYEKELLRTQTRISIELLALVIGIMVFVLMLSHDASFCGILSALAALVGITVVGFLVLSVILGLILPPLARKATHWKPSKTLKFIVTLLGIALLALLLFIK